MNDYVFDDKRYEGAVRNLKSTLFDIVALEETKLSDIEGKINTEFNELVKEGLRKIYSEQESTLRGVLKVTNELSDLLMKLDMYSRQLRSLESEKVSHAVTDTGNQEVEDAYREDVVVSDAMRDNVAYDMISSVNELNIPAEKKNEMVEDIQTIQNGVTLGNDVVPNEVSEVGQENVNQEEVSTDVAVDNADNASTDAVAETRAETEAEVESNANANADNQVVVPSVNEAVSENISVPSDTVAEAPTVDINFGGGSMFDDPNGVVQEAVANDGVTPVSESVETDVTTTQSPESAPVVDVVQEAVPSVDSPVIPEVSTVSAGSSASEVAVPGADGVMQNVVNNDGDILPPLSVSLPGEQVAVTTKEDGNANRFVKRDALPARAILTTNKQVTKLRESCGNQEALLVARGLLAQNSLASGTVAAIDKALTDAAVNISNEETAAINDATMENQLVNAGLLEATNADKQKQIEAMMEQANNLYREGKTAEAQKLYDEISNLNKELQSSQNISK